MERARIARTRRGDFRLRLEPWERDLLRSLPQMLREPLSSPDATKDPTLARLFPAAYPDDADRQSEYASMVHDDLVKERLEAIDVMESTLASDRLDEEQLAAWLGSLNNVRLVLGTRLDVTEDDDPSLIGENDPRAQALALYHYLGWLESNVIDALASGLDPEGSDRS